MECVKNGTRHVAGTGMISAFCLVLLAAMPLAGCSRLSQHPLVVAAVEEVSGNPRVAEMLGKPVTCGTAVRGTANETDGIASLQFDAERLAPTYRLIKGIPGRSYGLAIARRLQMPEAILARAEARVPTMERDLAALLTDL